MDANGWLHAARWAVAILGGLAAGLGVWTLRQAQGIPFFRLRRERLLRGWRWIGLGLLLQLVAWWALPRYMTSRDAVAEATPQIAPASAAEAPSPTPTPPPSPTPAPTVTPTPAVSYTPSVTPTAYIPEAILARFESTATPPPEARFSPITFTEGLDLQTFRPRHPGEVFQNPVGHMYALYSYDGMVDGVQWTALWLREGELVHFETRPWQGGTGGWDYTDWNPSPDQWLPGTYTVYIFVGTELVTQGTFVVEGQPPTLTPTPSPTAPVTPTPSPTPAPTGTPTPTFTPSPTRTPFTPVPTPTP